MRNLDQEIALGDALKKLDDSDPVALALKYAVSVIESYEIDVRSVQNTLDGFCQGGIYLTAQNTIRRILEEGLRV